MNENAPVKPNMAITVWTQVALGVTAAFSIVLAVRGLWRLRGGQDRSSNR